MLRVRAPRIAVVSGATGANASAAGSSTVSAVGALAPGIVAANASATGTSTVSASGKAVGRGPSVEQKFSRWASYRHVGSQYIRQVSPGVYLRARPEDKTPVVVVQEQEIGRLDKISLRGQAIADFINRTEQRKLRKELRRIRQIEAPKIRICGTSAATSGSSRVSIRGKARYIKAATGVARSRAKIDAASDEVGPKLVYTVIFHGPTHSELMDILEELEII